MRFLCALLWVTTSLWLCTSCIVVDTVEFDQEENARPQIITTSPPNDRIATLCEKTPWAFQVDVYDPNVDEEKIEAQISFSTSPYAPLTWTSPSSCALPSDLEPLEQSDKGSLVSFYCQDTLAEDLYPGSIAVVKVVVADEGFASPSQPRTESSTDTSYWFVLVEKCAL